MRKAQDKFLLWLREQGADSREILRKSRAEAIARLTAVKQLIGQMKMENLTEWITSFLDGTEQKLVVMGVHRDLLAGLKKKFPDSVLIDGSTPARERQTIVERFQTDPSTRLFLGNVQAAGTGITLTAASTLLFAEFSWVPGDHLQAEDRIHRISQDNPVQIYYSYVQGTIEEILLKTIRKKQDVINQVMDGGNVESVDSLEDLLQESLQIA